MSSFFFFLCLSCSNSLVLLGVPSLAGFCQPHPPGLTAKRLHAEVILREEERVQEYPLRITWLPVESNSRLDEDTNLTGYVFLVDSKKLPAACKSLHFIQGQVMVLSKLLATSYLFNHCILLTVYSSYDYIIQVLLIQSFCWASLISGCPFDA